MRKKSIIISAIVTIFLVAFFFIINRWIDKRNIEIYGDFYSENEFLKTIDCAELFDSNPSGTRYRISFDLKTKVSGNMIVYPQNGSSRRYIWEPYPLIETKQEYTHYEIEIEPFLIDEIEKKCYLSFYGEYGSGVIPIIKDLTIEPIL